VAVDRPHPPNRKASWRELAPGAILGAVGLELLKVAGAYYIPKAVASSSALYGSLGINLRPPRLAA